MGAKVRDVMTPGPIGVDYHQSIGEAARTMRDWGIGAVLVVRDGSLYGLITDRDLVIRQARSRAETLAALAAEDIFALLIDLLQERRKLGETKIFPVALLPAE